GFGAAERMGVHLMCVLDRVRFEVAAVRLFSAGDSVLEPMSASVPEFLFIMISAGDEHDKDQCSRGHKG
ncbi:MAG: hypothetical protein ACPLRM_05330, partial [Anaerolineae bacterium]